MSELGPDVAVLTEDGGLFAAVASAVAHAGGTAVRDTGPAARRCPARVLDLRRMPGPPSPLARCGRCPARLEALLPGDLLLVEGNRDHEPPFVRCYARSQLDALVSDLRRRLRRDETSDALAHILGDAPALQLVRDQVRSVARYRDVSVLILGETGTGKELVAKAIHDAGDSRAPFIAINCAAIPEPLFESELFGHEAGAYTGAQRARAGLLEAAQAGTLFLDEVGEMPASLQAKLLRVLETRTFRRVGSNVELPLRARLVSATNRGRSDGSLRADFHYRLCGFTIHLPPLRERAGDLSLLAAHFLRTFAEQHNEPPRRFSPQATAELATHPWPGNVRELKRFVEHLAIVTQTSEIGGEEVAALLSRAENGLRAADAAPAPTSLRDLEQTLITDAFRRCEGNISRTAKQLGLPRSTVRRKLDRYGIR